MPARAIHQFALSCHPGDGITNGMLLTQRLLRQAGIDANLYAVDIDPVLADRVLPLARYQGHPDQALLIHHGIGNSAGELLRALPDRRFLVFHNITPAAFFAPDDPIQPLLAEGWRQLDDWRPWLAGAIADSRCNLELLLERGYASERCAVIPLLVDLERLAHPRPEHAARPLDDGFRLLFVGRLMPHKNQLGLIETLAHLRRLTGQAASLTLVGAEVDAAYVERLRARAVELGVRAAVTLTGKVSDAELARQLQQADLYVSLSHHEGFGMPLIEAMAMRLPVLAYAAPATSIAETLGSAGLLLASDEPRRVAAAIAELMTEPRLRAALAARAAAHLERFAPRRLYDELRAFLARHAVDLPAAHVAPPAASPPIYRIEGPFDSSYSLAIVNRQLALALERRHPGAVALWSTEGPGDYPPDPAALVATPTLARLAERARTSVFAEHCLRLLYPPRVTGMKGRANLLGCYGWEESVLPWDAVVAFNQHLTGVTTMSRYVSRVLIDNGVMAPIHAIGIGADHLLAVEPEPAALPALGRGLRLLHISSCFPRKGVDALLAAFAQAFHVEDDVTLVIKTFPNPHHDIECQLADWRAAHPAAPPVVLINRDLGDGALRALYQACHVLVAPSRGEGFGLPLAEAMLHRLPVIATGYGGQSDFCSNDTAWLIDYRFARARTHMAQPASVWVEPDSGHLAALLAAFYREYRAGSLDRFSAARVERAAALIQREFTWDAVAARLAALLQAPARFDAPWLQPDLALGCVTTWNSRCGIATYSRRLLGPALGDALIFANADAERTHEDESRVRRCWNAAGQRDDLTNLEQAIRAARVRQVLIQFNFSFFDLGALKRLLAALHASGIQTFIGFHSTADVDWGGQLKTLRDLLPQLRDCQRLFVHSSADLNRLKDWDVGANATLLPHGVDSQPVPALPRPTVFAGRRVLASYGFLLPHKGLPELIEAFARLLPRHSDLHLLLLNAEYPTPISATTAALCRQRIAELGLGERVTLMTDYLDDAVSRAWLAHAELIVFPYQHTQESSSAAVRWGLASRKPVLCTPLDIFEDVAGAVRFLPGTAVADLAAGLDRWLLADSAARDALRESQQRWIEQHDWTRVSRRLRQMLISIQLNAGR